MVPYSTLTEYFKANVKVIADLTMAVQEVSTNLARARHKLVDTKVELRLMKRKFDKTGYSRYVGTD